MATSKNLPRNDVEVTAKAKSRSVRKPLPGVNPDALKAMLEPLAATVPSQNPAPLNVQPHVIEGEIQPPNFQDLKSIDDYYHAIGTQITNARKSFMRIGELIAKAEQEFGREARAALVHRLEDEFQVSRSTLSQMSTAYRAISTNKLPPELQEVDYTTVCLLAGLSDTDLRAAKKQGLLSLPVQRREIRSFIAKRKAPQLPVRHELDRLRDEEARLTARLEEIRKRIIELQ